MLNVEKTKTNYDKAMIKYDNFVKSPLPRLPVYKYLTESPLNQKKIIWG